MNYVDWIIVIIYVVFILSISFLVGKEQDNQRDYYLGGKKVSYWLSGLSLMANQVSAISLIGVPAFVALRAGGGLKWLQYEIALPLSMAFIIIFFLPVYTNTKGFTVYGYIENKLGKETAKLLSIVFLVSRLLAGSISLLATAYVTSICINIELKLTIIIIGAIALIYTSFGGIKADIYSDVAQLIILWGSSLFMLFLLIFEYKIPLALNEIPSHRLQTIDFSGTGFFDGKTFAFLPMLLGTLFLYISYYGCDQTQAQRLLSVKNEKEIKKSLIINGILRFLLVLTYTGVGFFLLLFLKTNPEFLKSLNGKPPDYLIPYFLKNYIPHGILGIAVSGIFAATMSSLDSTINSLSAVFYEELLPKRNGIMSAISEKTKLWISRGLTLVFGILLISSSFLFMNAGETVVELVNKIGSAFYGPIAGLFFVAVFFRKENKIVVVLLFIFAVFFNIFLWLAFSNSISWLWWNVIGFLIIVLPLLKQLKVKKGILKSNLKQISILILWFLFIMTVLVAIEHTLK